MTKHQGRMTKKISISRMKGFRFEVLFMSLKLRHSFVIRRSSFVIFYSFALLSIAAEPPPSAKEILTSVRLQQAQQQIDLQGQLRENEKVIPFHLTQKGAVIRYDFSNPTEALQLRLGDNDSRLEEVTRSGAEKITAAQ